jgi:hypothetical protein
VSICHFPPHNFYRYYDSPAFSIQTAKVTGAVHEPIAYFQLKPLSPSDKLLPVCIISNSTTVVDDACNQLPPMTPDLSGCVVVVRRGTCPFVRCLRAKPDSLINVHKVQKLANIAAKGGKVVLIYECVRESLGKSQPLFNQRFTVTETGSML